MTIRTNSEGDVTHTGGVTRVQFGAPEPETQSPLQADHQSTRVGNESLRFGGGQVQSTGVTRYVAGSDAPTHSVMATARQDRNGLSVELVPGQPASRTTIATALREGLVRETSPGYFEDIRPLSAPAEGEPGQGAEPVKEPTSDQPFSYIAADHMEEWQEMVDPISQPAYDGTVAAAMASIARGDAGLDNAVQRLVQESGMDPAQAEELVETGLVMHRENLTRDLAGTGLISRDEAEEFYDWCREHRRLPEALSALLLAGQTGVFRSLCREFTVKRQGGRL